MKGFCYEFWRSKKPEVGIEIWSWIPNSNRLVSDKIFSSAPFPTLQDGGLAHVGYKQGFPSTVESKVRIHAVLTAENAQYG